jgi:hypothetical protein
LRRVGLKQRRERASDFAGLGDLADFQLELKPGCLIQFEQNARVEDYALITIKPAAQSKNTIMTFEGIRSVGTGAAAEFVTGKSYLAEKFSKCNQVL